VTQPIERTDTTDGPPPAPPSGAAWPRRQAAEQAAMLADGSGAPAERPEGPPDPRLSNNVRLALVAVVVVVAFIQFGPSAFYIVGALLVSIVLHEFGHYWVARCSGMKVSEFFVGFGPRLWSFHRGETEYGVKAIPAGAYVRIVGMNDLEEVDPADEPRTYRAQGTFKRLFTVLAGPAMNLLIAFVLMTGVFLAYGREADSWAVQTVSPGSAAEVADVRAGDRVLTVDGQSVGTWDSFREQLREKAGRTVTFTIERDGATMTRPVDLGWRLDATTAAAVPSQPALSKADVIETADGRPLPRYDDLRALLADAGPPVTLRVVRGTDAYDLKVDRPLSLPPDGAAGFLGVVSTNDMVRETPIGAVGETTRVLRDGVVATGGAFSRIFTPSGVGNLAGQVADATQSTTTMAPNTAGRLTPVGDSPEASAGAVSADRPISIIGIFRLGSEAADIGLYSFLLLVAAVNLALALINLAPMLPMDGGHAVIALYEGVRGRLRGAPYRADIAKLMPVVYAFVAVLVLLGVTSMLLDALRPPSLR
jgi:RIP metalloprotease RseP